MVDKELFLRDTMPNIFRSSDIDSLLMNSLHALKKHIPINALDFSYYSKESNSVVSLCKLGDDGKMTKNTVRKFVSESKPMQYLDDVYTLNDCYSHFRDRPRMCPIEDISTLVMNCRDNESVIGYFSIKAKGDNVYGDEHKELMRELLTPYNSALLHSLVTAGILKDNHISRPQTFTSGHETSVIIGSNGCLRDVTEQAAKVASFPSAVLLTGETGTGKDVFANYIHSVSERRNEPFIKINCGAIPENLIESEFFGHEKGSFTGADSQKKGCFELADGGTLFLDEVGELSPAAQTKLLRALQFGEIRRVGGTKALHVNVRIIAATNRDLAEMADDGSFRKDLYWRLNVFPIDIPPLRERREDIPLLVDYLIKRKCSKFNMSRVPQVSTAVMQKLVKYDWPGNIREMENAIEREIITSNSDSLKFDAIVAGRVIALADRSVVSDNPHLLDEAMKSHIMRALEQTKWRISGKHGAADIMGINPSTLRHKMRKFGLL
jgi:transcriptional regulator with GAF, ATPase, and Fis domain